MVLVAVSCSGSTQDSLSIISVPRLLVLPSGWRGGELRLLQPWNRAVYQQQLSGRPSSTVEGGPHEPRATRQHGLRQEPLAPYLSS